MRDSPIDFSNKKYKIEMFRRLMDKTIYGIEYSDGDEGFIITFSDGTKFDFGFSSCEGWVRIK